MNGTIKGLVAIAALFTTVACSDASPTEPTLTAPGAAAFAKPGSGAGTLSFTSTQDYSNSTPQTATGGTGAIDFTGSLTTGTPCYDVTASHSGSSTITVTVTAAPTGGGCIQVVTNNNYTGRISGLAAGTYGFTVVHAVGTSRTTAYSSTVTVQ